MPAKYTEVCESPLMMCMAATGALTSSALDSGSAITLKGSDDGAVKPDTTVGGESLQHSVLMPPMQFVLCSLKLIRMKVGEQAEYMCSHAMLRHSTLPSRLILYLLGFMGMCCQAW